MKGGGFFSGVFPYHMLYPSVHTRPFLLNPSCTIPPDSLPVWPQMSLENLQQPVSMKMEQCSFLFFLELTNLQVPK
jgi:hypothetical protein